jgi:hypothetical protein
MRAPIAALVGLSLVASTAAAQSAGIRGAYAPSWRPVPGGQTTPAPTSAPARWYRDAVADAYRAALESGRPLVLMIGEDGEHRYTTRMIQTVLPSPAFARVAEGAVLAYSNPSLDSIAQRVATDLKIDRYPTIVLLAPNRAKLDEVARVVGVFAADTIVDFLAKHMQDRGWLAAEPTTVQRQLTYPAPEYPIIRRRGRCM